MIGTQKYLLKIIVLVIVVIFISSGLISIPTGLTPNAERLSSSELSTVSACNNYRSSPRDLGVAGYSSRADIDDTNVMYAIIAPDIFQEELESLADWKTRKGVPAKIYHLNGTNGILSSYSGRDDAEKLHNFLMELDDTSPELTWLLLAGDAGIIPIRELHADAVTYNVEKYYVSDYYYAGLDHNWDFNYDGVYGDGTSEYPPIECDWSPNVYVGRLPVNNEAETTVVVNKILTYEQSPPSGNWVKSAALWGGLMDAPNDLTPTSQDGDPAYDPEQDNAYEVKELNVLPLIPPSMSVTKRYDYAQIPGGNYNKANDNLYRAPAIGDFNSGNSLVNFAGQAYYCGAAILDYTDPTGQKHIGINDAYDDLLWWYDARDSTNGYKLPLVFLCTCGAGDFAEGEKPGDDTTWKDKTMEHLITSSSGGAIGLIGSTGSTYRGEDSSGKTDGNWWLDAKFWELFFDGNYQQGKCFYQMKMEYINDIFNRFVWQQPPYKAELFGYNLQGDPEVAIWTDTPRSLTVFTPGIWVGEHNISVQVLGITDEPIENARVCLQNSEIYLYGVTNETGEALIKVEAASTGTIDIVVTAHNFLPYEDVLDITIEPADLTLDSSDIVFSNNYPDENEQITITATVHNQGQTDCTSPVTIRFTDGNPNNGGVQIGNDKIINDNIVIGGYKTVQIDWTAAGGGNHSIYVEIDPEVTVVESYKNNNIAYKDLGVKQPDLSITAEDITFEPTGTVSQNEQVTISAVVHNEGEVSVASSIVRFYDGDFNNGGTRVGSDKTITAIDIGKTAQTSVTWTPTGAGMDHDIYVRVDPNDSIAELNETNNAAFETLHVNSPPSISELPDLELDEDSKSLDALDIELFLYDADNIISELSITLQNTNASYCLVNLTTELRINIIPVANWSGLSTVTIDVSDGIDSIQAELKITVKPINDPPVMNPIGVFELNESEPFNFTVIATDIDSEDLTFSDDTSLFDIDPDTGTISFTPTASDIGDHYITIRVSDNDPASPGVDDELLTLKIINVPNPPVPDEIGTLYATAGELFRYTVTASDPDSELLLFSDDTPLFDIERRSGIITFLPSEVDAGHSYIVKITVSDGMLNGTETFTLYINSSEVEPNGPDSNDTPTEDESAVVPVLLLVLIIIVIAVAVVVTIKYRKGSEQKAWDEFRKPDNEQEYERVDHQESTEAGPELSPISKPAGPDLRPKKKTIKKKIKKNALHKD